MDTIMESITPLNKLPVLITGPGMYKTRSGHFVEISEAFPNIDLSCTAFTCKGHILKTSKSGKRVLRTYNTWHPSGAASVFNGPTDIVERV